MAFTSKNNKNFSQKRARHAGILGAFMLSCLMAAPTTVFADAECHGVTYSAMSATCHYTDSIVRAPSDGQGTDYKTTVSGGTTVTSTGTMVFNPGLTGFDGFMTLEQLQPDFTNVTSAPGLPTDVPTLLDVPVVVLGFRNHVIQYIDPITGDAIDFSIFDNAVISEHPLKNELVPSFYGVGDQQYIDLRLGEVDATGGTLIIENTFQSSSGVVGDIHIAAKHSTLFLATGDGSASSRIIWNVATPTTINMGAAATGEDDNAQTREIVVGWPVDVEVHLVDGTTVTYNITDMASFLAFNDALKGYIQNLEIPISETLYENYINQALNSKTVDIEYIKNVENPQSPTEYVYVSNGEKNILKATGQGASVEIAAGSTLNGINVNNVLRAEHGATAINDGELNITLGSAIVIKTDAGQAIRTSATNNNLLNVHYGATGVFSDNADFTNETSGIINVDVSNDADPTTHTGTYTSYGLRATNGSTAENKGIINVGANSGLILEGSSHGAIVDNSIFTNSGMIYLGRQNQQTAGDPTIPTTIQASEAFTGVYVTNASNVVNTGNIIIGSLSDGIDAIRVENTDTATVLHSGNIEIYGDTGRAKINRGIYVYNSGVRTIVDDVATNTITMSDTGVITLDGANGAGLHVVAEGNGNFSSASMNGLIKVQGTRDPSTGTRNHGVWTEGRSNGEAIVDVNGIISLEGNGAIGLHARGKSSINVSDSGNVLFENGTDQIGYFIHGSDANIRVLRSDLSVSTERSNLFRIEDGAIFDGRDYNITVSGKDAVGILSVGLGSLVNAQSGLYNVTGNGAAAIHISGGSQGWIYDDATILLNGDSAKGIISDGNLYNIYHQIISSDITTTQAHTSTDIFSTHKNVVGFTAMNSATLNYVSRDLLAPNPYSPVPTSSPRLSTHLLGDNSIAFKGTDNSVFNIHNADVMVNGWVFDTENGNHTIDITDMNALGTDGFLRNTTAAGKTASVATASLKNTIIQGIITTDAVSSTHLQMDSDTIWIGAGGSNLTTLENAGHISMPGQNWDNVFRTLSVSGDYTGLPDSTILMHVSLDNGSTPKTDKLIFGNTYGETILSIKNAGGYGGQTKGDGIEIIEVAGTSDGVFTLEHRLFAGAYEYELFKDSLLAANGHWYLRSTGLRPEVPIYSASNNFMARFGREMIGTYRDRYGYAETTPNNERGWGRAFGSFGDTRRSRENPIADTQTFFKHGTSYDFSLGGFQTGMDVMRRGGNGAPHNAVGFYVGAGHGVANIHHVMDGNAGKLRQNAYSAGTYWTHVSAEENWYVDALAQATYYGLNSTTSLHMTDKTHGMGYAGSLEAGYKIPLNASNSWSVEPQAQLIYQHTNIKDITDHAGIIRFNDTNNIYGRLGARFVNTHLMPDKQPIQTWLRTDLWKDLTPKTYTDFLAFDGTLSTQVKNKPMGTWGQIGLGVSGFVTNNVSLFVSGDYTRTINDKNEHSWNGRAGLTVQW